MEIKRTFCSSVDVGVIADRARNKEGKQISVTREIDFVATKGGKKSISNRRTKNNPIVFYKLWKVGKKCAIIVTACQKRAQAAF